VRRREFIAGLSGAAVWPVTTIAQPVATPIPDRPRSFSYKTSWFAIRSDRAFAVANALDLADPRPANWETGVDAAYLQRVSNRQIFVTPPAAGWILAVGNGVPDPGMPLFRRLFSELARHFNEVQFFGNHRVVDYYAWARAIDGKIRRLLFIANGEVVRNVGPQSPEEAGLGLADLSGLDPVVANSRIFDLNRRIDEQEQALIAQGTERREANRAARRLFPKPEPDEQDVLNLAGMWSVNPRGFDQLEGPLDVGLLGQLSAH
jgi:hypothetical protein